MQKIHLAMTMQITCRPAFTGPFISVKYCHLGLLVSTICHMIQLGSDSKVLSLAWSPNTHTHGEREREKDGEYTLWQSTNNCFWKPARLLITIICREVSQWNKGYWLDLQTLQSTCQRAHEQNTSPQIAAEAGILWCECSAILCETLWGRHFYQPLNVIGSRWKQTCNVNLFEVTDDIQIIQKRIKLI